MADPKITFKVICAHCHQPFNVRYPLARPDAPGEGEVAVTCQYCEKQVIITIPRRYIKEVHLVRGLESAPAPVADAPPPPEE